MLALKRNVEQEILIGNDIRIKVLQVVCENGRSWVRLGIDAPLSVPIVRKELLHRLDLKKQAES